MVEIVNIIKQVGFPIFVAVFLLCSIKQLLQKLIEVVRDLQQTIALLREDLMIMRDIVQKCEVHS